MHTPQRGAPMSNFEFSYAAFKLLVGFVIALMAARHYVKGNTGKAIFWAVVLAAGN